MFDWNGKEVYRKAGQKIPYIVWVKKEMEIRKGPGSGYGKADRKCPTGMFTIVEVKNGWENSRVKLDGSCLVELKSM